MANRYWVNGTGNWSDTAQWSATSGGSSGAAVPTASDDVFIDSNSGLSGGTLTLNVIPFSSCKNFTSTSGFSYTITPSPATARLNCYGSMVLESGLTLTVYYISFNSDNEGETILSDGCVINSTYSADFGGNGSWKLLDDFACTGGFAQENGTFDANGFDITTSDFYFYSGTDNTPTFYKGSGTMTPAYPTDWVLDENDGVSISLYLYGYIHNVSKPSTSITNTQNTPVQYETWDSNTTTWDTETRTWDKMGTIWTNSTRPTASITNVNKPK